MSTDEKIRMLVDKVSSMLDTGIRRIVEQSVKNAVRQSVLDKKKTPGDRPTAAAKPKAKPAGKQSSKKVSSYGSDSDDNTDSD
jgi:hypothetical protein